MPKQEIPTKLYLNVHREYAERQEKRFHIDGALSHGFDELFFFFCLFQVTREVFGHLHERLHIYPFVF